MLTRVDDITTHTAIPTEIIKQNILDAGSRNLIGINSLFGQRREGAVALVGGGPSLANKDIQSKLKHYSNVIVCGSAHNYFVSKCWWGVNDNVYCIVCDPDPIMSKYLTCWSKKITYLVASQCDKAVFEQLKDAPKKYIWDCAGSDQYNKNLFKDAEKLIVGGCTVGTRAIGMAMAMGYKKLHLYGYDSCITRSYKHHAYNFYDEEVESLGDIHEIKLGGKDVPPGTTDPTFICAGYMVAQIFDFKNILFNYADKLDIEIFGGGALDHLMKLAKLKLEEHKNGKVT